MEDILARLPNEEELSLYPDEVSLGGRIIVVYIVLNLEKK
jgi:hypothetical protein